MRGAETLRAKTLSVAASSLASAVLLGVAAIVIARSLGPAGRGTFAVAYSMMFVVMILVSVGIGPAGRRLLAIGPQGGVTLAEYAGTARRLVALHVPVAVVSALFLLPFFGGGNERSTQVAFFVCGTCSLASFLAREALFGIHAGQIASLILAIGCGATLLGVIVVTVTGQSSVAWYLSMYAIAAAGEAAAATIVARRRRPGGDAPVRPQSRGALLRGGRAVLVLQLAQAAASRGDRLVIGAVAGAFDLGHYAVAVSVMELLSMGAVALGSVAFQGIASGSLSPAAMRRAHHVVVDVTAAAALVLVLTAPWLVRFAFGSQFDPAIGPLRILAIAAIPFSSLQIDMQHLTAAGRARLAAALAVSTAIGMVIGDLLAVAAWGIHGAAWVSVVVFGLHAVAGRSASNRLRVVGASG